MSSGLMKKNCYFCLTLKSQKDFLWENDYFFANFDGNPVSPGHALLIPKRHIKNISQLNLNETSLFFESIEKVKKRIEKSNLIKIYTKKIENLSNPNSVLFVKKALDNLKNNGSKIAGFNYGINEGETAGQTINHLHLHIIPRYRGDVKNPLGGVRNTIPGMGDYKNPK